MTTQLTRKLAKAATMVIGRTLGKLTSVGSTACEMTRASAGAAFSPLRDVASR